MQTVNKQQLSDVGLVFSLSPKPPIKDIKHHRKAVHVTGFGGLVFLSNEVHRNDFFLCHCSTKPFSAVSIPSLVSEFSQPTMKAAHNFEYCFVDLCKFDTIMPLRGSV